ncbi:endonuclease III [bacterium]|nr:endonuclease III [bacterium]
MRESKTDKQTRAKEIFIRLESIYKGAKCALHFTSAWELMVATILSAQCTDKRVNIVTPILFKRYPTVNDFAKAEKEKLQEYIHSTGFFRNKAKNIIGAANTVVDNFGGKVPDTMEKLVTIPGIARKSANVILYVWYGKNEGVVVDTHVKRLSNRLGLTKKENPVKIERDLMKLYPRKQWGKLSYYMVDHGRAICKAPTPKCADCKLKDICPSSGRYL